MRSILFLAFLSLGTLSAADVRSLDYGPLGEPTSIEKYTVGNDEVDPALITGIGKSDTLFFKSELIAPGQEFQPTMEKMSVRIAVSAILSQRLTIEEVLKDWKQPKTVSAPVTLAKFSANSVAYSESSNKTVAKFAGQIPGAKINDAIQSLESQYRTTHNIRRYQVTVEVENENGELDSGALLHGKGTGLNAFLSNSGFRCAAASANDKYSKFLEGVALNSDFNFEDFFKLGGMERLENCRKLE